MVCLAVDHRGRHLDGGERDGFVDGRGAELAAHTRLGGRLHTRADVGAQFLERIELADVGGEGVIQLGHDLGLDLLHVDLEGGRLAGELLGLIVVGEGDVEHDLFAALRPDQGLFETGDEIAAADLEHLIGALSALDERAVLRAFEVHEHEVIGLHGAVLDRFELGEPLLQHGQLRVDLCLSDFDHALRHLKPLVLAQLGHGHGLHLDREGVVGGLVERARLEVRRADRVVVQAGLAQGFIAPLRDGLLQGLGAQVVGADVLDHEVHGHATLAEAGKHHLAADLGDEAVIGLPDRLGRDLDGKLGLVLGCGIDLGFHSGFSVSAIGGPRRFARRHPRCGPCGGQAEACGAGERT